MRFKINYIFSKSCAEETLEAGMITRMFVAARFPKLALMGSLMRLPYGSSYLNSKSITNLT